MFNLRYLLNPPFGFHTYIWVDVILIRETSKAILIMFDGRKNWFPKVWIIGIKRYRNSDTAKIKISQYHWAKKF